MKYLMCFSLKASQTRRSSVRTSSCSNWDDECWRQWCVSGTQRDVTYWTSLQPTRALL